MTAVGTGAGEGAQPLRAGIIVQAALVVGLVASLVTVIAAQRLPAPNASLELVSGEIRATGISGVQDYVVAVALYDDARRFELEADDLIEEPDVLPSWQHLARFFERQGELWQLLQSPNLSIETITGALHPVEVRTRTIGQLPLAFWVQVFDALIVLLIGAATFAFSDRSDGARLYAVSAFGFATALWPAAIYSTRPLAVEPTSFHWLSTLDHFGGHVLCLGLCVMLARFPKTIIPRASWLFLLLPVFLIPDHLMLASKDISGFHTANLLVFIAFVAIAFLQRRACKNDPIARASLGWAFLSIMIGVLLFVTLFTIPTLLKSQPLASQAVALTAVVLTYAGMSLGVLRYRLFELDRWWFRVWSWILGIVVIVISDLLLVRVFSVSEGNALVTTLILVGALYFPIRQWAIGRIGYLRSEGPGFDMSTLIGADSPESLEAHFEQALQTMFAPLRISFEPNVNGTSAELAQHGASLMVPLPDGTRIATCEFRNSGANLYRPEDVTRAGELMTVGRSIHRAMLAREEGQLAERDRIRRDLHDDLGASISHIVQQAGDARTVRLAKSAMVNLREILAALDNDATRILELLLELETDCRARTSAEARGMSWQQEGYVDAVVNPRQRANLARVMREATTNALKHGVGDVRYKLEIFPDRLEVNVRNETAKADETHGGRGLGHIRTRIEELGGCVEHATSGSDFELSFTVPWQGSTDAE